MLIKHKNKIFSEIEKNQFNPADFGFADIGERISRVSVKGADLYFDFLVQPDDFEVFKTHFTRFTPTPTAAIVSNRVSFSKALTLFSEWLVLQVKQFIDEKDAEDLFEKFKSSQEQFDFGSNVGEFFAPYEIDVIIPKLEKIKTFIQENFKASEEQNLKIETALNHLAESITKQSKFDWKSIFVSTIIGVATTLTLDTENGSMLWNFIVDLFKEIPLLGQ